MPRLSERAGMAIWQSICRLGSGVWRGLYHEQWRLETTWIRDECAFRNVTMTKGYQSSTVISVAIRAVPIPSCDSTDNRFAKSQDVELKTAYLLEELFLLRRTRDACAGSPLEASLHHKGFSSIDAITEAMGLAEIEHTRMKDIIESNISSSRE
ncbi:hypothetical protein llap_13346 [Limosa lapponica baueri]|uniref:Uncharacterized protein n=1 Tax=Limosa lapponica baueri TaxID=1758121 RepID=A0A2I0TRD1_LIMLA|nr:hypothetical protein llap_13346 [Limosa lapponica baueri]